MHPLLEVDPLLFCCQQANRTFNHLKLVIHFHGQSNMQSIQMWDFVFTDFLVIVSPFQLHQISALGHSILPQLHREMSVDQLNFCWPLWRRSVTETAFIRTSMACAVFPSVPASSTDFSFQNLVFWISLNFQQQKSV